MNVSSPLPGTPGFFQTVWGRRPATYPGLVSAANARALDRAWFFECCRPPARARLYVYESSGAARATRLDAVEEAEGIYRLLRDRGDSFTLLLNDVDRVSPEVRGLRAGMGIGRRWRYDDVVATLSTPGSGIGYHAGHEDGFLIQLRGRRWWRLWNPTVLPPLYREALLGRPGSSITVPPRAESPPDVDVRLDSGDVLHVPALFAHEGVTLEEESIALSIAWVGMTPRRILQRAGYSVAVPHDAVLDAMVPDVDPSDTRAVAALVDTVMQAAAAVGTPRPPGEDVRRRMIDLISGNPEASVCS